mmetsp:Transcript_25187/g.38211  ORF Transcript_25187/g.38211 Transcript_25187/m.38211 type:complete len:484 (-) Transcript_25187:350-1801(-)|eukprot:CAMPEP_0178934880 /NCGR_PEP_ID=MMETSP0786-20121207/24167_1 /TAXON_ID=186022 /ORGANISM="Thalassionema frauenfeldii, Strain CCMP 1798" /LENGTH=483 /DNA_ID=CAMNT_0020612829 /DNA_START=241 /DNA_END=1692 /DNA_ORIENTATION=-
MSTLPDFPQDESCPASCHSSLDILLGKEKAAFNHSGNKRFRAIVNHNVPKYMGAETKSCKTQLVRKIHEDMKKSGFRFLKKKKGEDASTAWQEIEESDAREKVSHALRDRVRELRKPTKYCRRSQQEISPMMVLFQEHPKVRSAINVVTAKDIVSAPSSHDIIYPAGWSDNQDLINKPLFYEHSCVNAIKPPSSNLPKVQRRLSQVSISGHISVEKEGQCVFRSGEKRRSSLSEWDDGIQPRKLARGLTMTNVTQAKDISLQSRRSSMDSLFGGMAHEIADAQPTGFRSRRTSLICSGPENERHDDPLPLQYITFPNVCESSSQTFNDSVSKHNGSNVNNLLGMYGHSNKGGDIFKNDSTPVNFLTILSSLEQSKQVKDEESLTKSNERKSTEKAMGSYDKKNEILDSARSGRRLSMLTLSLGDFSQPFSDVDCQLSAISDRRMSMVSLSLEGFHGKTDGEDDFTKSCRRQSILSTISGFASL